MQRARGAHLQGEVQAEAARASLGALALLEEGHSPARTRRTDRAVRGRGGGGLSMPNRKTQVRPAPAVRFGTYPMREELSGEGSAKSLTKGKTSSGGRNTRGRMTSRHRGGGAKRRYRRDRLQAHQDGVAPRMELIEYDPNRSGPHRADQLRQRRQALHPRPAGTEGRRRDRLRRESRHRAGQLLAAGSIPTGSVVHNVSWCRVRAAARPRRRHRDPGGRQGGPDGQPAPALLRGPYGARRVPRDRRHVSNAEHQNIKIGKAGRNRHKGKRPQTRGVAMNPVDHPHGGGEAHHTPGGHPVTPWGKPTLGYRTRKKGKRRTT